jgi:hypothetical protein
MEAKVCLSFRANIIYIDITMFVYHDKDKIELIQHDNVHGLLSL